jgi:hypothetical protein
MRTHFVYRNGKWVERGGPEDTGYEGVAPRIHVITDTMEPTQSMLSGRYFSSKSQMYKEGRALGYECRGNEKFPERREVRDPSLKQTIIDVVNSQWKN